MGNDSNRPVVLVGAGMHGRVVRDICRDASTPVAGYLDDFTAIGTDIEDVKVLGPTALFRDAAFATSHRFIVTIGNNYARRNIANQIRDAGGELTTAIHPNCVVSPSVRIGSDTVLVGANMVFSGAVIGSDVLIDPDATVGVESQIGDGAYLCPGVHLGARVSIGAYSFIGVSAVVLPEVVVGKGSIVGAGAVVTRDIADETLAVGNPAIARGKAEMDAISPYPARRRNRSVDGA